MSRQFSVYLDALRLCAALTVVISHLIQPRFSGDLFQQLRDAPAFGHHAVIIFFVLSGFLVAYSAERAASLRSYAEARISRLMSVIMPMLLIVPLLDAVGRSFADSLYSQANDMALLTVPAALSLMGQFWFADIPYLSNDPFWSLSYEFAFYAMFGIFCFTHGTTRRLLLIAGVLLIGPKILLLALPWIAGAALYHWREQLSVRFTTGLLLMIGSIVTYAAGAAAGLFKALAWYASVLLGLLGSKPAIWGYSSGWLSDYAITLLVSLNLVGAMAMFRERRVRLPGIAPAITWLAGGSFALYLFHYPIMLAAAAMVGGIRSTPAGAALIFATGLIGSYLLAEISDRRLPEWRAAVRQFTDKLRAPRASVTPSS